MLSRKSKINCNLSVKRSNHVLNSNFFFKAGVNSHASGRSQGWPKGVKLILWETESLSRLHTFCYYPQFHFYNYCWNHNLQKYAWKSFEKWARFFLKHHLPLKHLFSRFYGFSYKNREILISLFVPEEKRLLSFELIIEQVVFSYFSTNFAGFGNFNKIISPEKESLN